QHSCDCSSLNSFPTRRSSDLAALRSLATIFTVDDEIVTDDSPDLTAEWESVRECLGEDTAQLLTLIKGHPWIRSLLEATTSAIGLDDLEEELLGTRSAAAQRYLSHVIAGLSFIPA